MFGALRSPSRSYLSFQTVKVFLSLSFSWTDESTREISMLVRSCLPTFVVLTNMFGFPWPYHHFLSLVVLVFLLKSLCFAGPSKLSSRSQRPSVCRGLEFGCGYLFMFSSRIIVSWNYSSHSPDNKINSLPHTRRPCVLAISVLQYHGEKRALL